MPFSRRIAPVLVLAGFVTLAHAGIRSPGKYCGVVVYDRWGGCTLYSGIFVMYIAEGSKEKLRAHSGESILIDARKVVQEWNPGDGLITDFDYRGAAPSESDAGSSIDGLRLEAAPSFGEGERPRIIVTIENVGNREQVIRSDKLAPTLLTRQEPGTRRSPSDGPSRAVVTRQSFRVGDGPRTEGGSGVGERSYAWRIEEALPEVFHLKPGERRRILIEFDLPPGEYDFLAGYGGGVHASRGLASPLVAFDVGPGGRARVAKVDRK